LLLVVTVTILWRFGRPSGGLALAVAGVLAAGIAGYAVQGRPGLPAHPVETRAAAFHGDTSFAKERGALLENLGDVGAWLNFADALQRAGLTEKSVEAMKVATKAFPDSPDLWVGLGNALVIHSDGLVSPAARLAFGRAAEVAPDHPAPLYFLGLAWLQSGNPDEALKVWETLRARSRPDAPWLPDLDRKIAAAKTMRAAGVGAP
jgi:cytochrome c-type biogenesis protein CcmH/NrfG